MKNLRFFSVVVLFLSLTLFLFSCGRDVKDDGKLAVIASIFPVYDFAREIGGDNASVKMLLPPGMEPHSFDPTPRDIRRIEEADIFVYNGAEMEPWVEDILNGIENPDLVVIDSSSGVTLLEGGHHHEGEEGHEAEETGKAVDPHIWTDFGNAKIQVDNILSAFLMKDPENAGTYQERTKVYKWKLDTLDEMYRNALSDCPKKEIVSSGHFAFSYLAHRYGLVHYAVYGASPDAEPSPAELIEIVEIVKKNDIKYIFGEELVNPKMAETLKEETGAEILFVNPAGNVSKSAFKEGVTFIDIMTDNLSKFKMGLGCQ